VVTKVLAAVGVATLVAVLIGALGMQSLGAAADRTDQMYNRNVLGVSDAAALRNAMTNVRLASRDAALAADRAGAQKSLDSIPAFQDHFHEVATDVRAGQLAADQVALLDRLESGFTAYLDEMDAVMMPRPWPRVISPGASA
jgi:methyl-accepting chemotaxis protein